MTIAPDSDRIDAHRTEPRVRRGVRTRLVVAALLALPMLGALGGRRW